MTGGWVVGPPFSNDQWGKPTVGATIPMEFSLDEYTSEDEVVTCLHWSGLSRQQVSNLRSLAVSDALKDLVSPYGYSISNGCIVDWLFEKDPNDAEYDLMISSEATIPEEVATKIVDFVKQYKVQ